MRIGYLVKRAFLSRDPDSAWSEFSRADAGTSLALMTPVVLSLHTFPQEPDKIRAAFQRLSSKMRLPNTRLDISSVKYNPSYSPTSNTVSVGKTTPISILAHELGHAQQAKVLTPKMLQALSALRVASMVGLPLASAAAFLASQKQKERDYKPVAIPAALALPTFLEEADASRRALKYLYKDKGLLRTVPGALRLVAPLASYALGPIGVAAGIRALKKMDAREAGQSKNS